MKVTQSCPALCDLMDYMYPARLLCPWDSPGQNTGVGCHALLQGMSSSQGLNPGLLHWRKILYCLSHQGSKNRKEFYWSQTENYSLEVNFPEHSEKLPGSSRVFSTISCLVRTKTMKLVKDTFIQGFKKKKKKGKDEHSKSVWPWRLEESLIIKGVSALVSQKEAFNLYF